MAQTSLIVAQLEYELEYRVLIYNLLNLKLNNSKINVHIEDTHFLTNFLYNKYIYCEESFKLL